MFKNVYKNDAMKREEHMAVRNTAGWYLWTHELVEVEGPDAAALLEYLFTGSIGNLAPSRARYTTMLNENGQIIDDVVIWCMGENKYWVSTLYAKRMIPWFTQHKGEKDVAFKNITAQWDMYAVQGPKSREILNELVDTPVDDQKFFQILDNTIDGVPVKVNRGGFTGEKWGYEVYIAPENTKLVVEKLRQIAPKYDAKQVTDIQVMVWTLPVEKGWEITVDGVKTDYVEILDALIAVPLSAGTHTIEFKFTTAGYPEALIISGTGLALFIAMIFIYYKFFYSKKNGKIVVDGKTIPVQEAEE